jgi:hypothetical protein
MFSPDTRQNVTRLRARQDNFQQQIVSAITWDISALDFVDPKIGHSLRTLVMKIESRAPTLVLKLFSKCRRVSM